jgi:hypothetical protein
MKIGPLEIKIERVVTFGIIAIVIFLLADFNARLVELNSKEQKLASVGAQGTAIMQTQIALSTAEAYATSVAAVDEWARNEAHMVKPGDNPIVPLPAPGTTPVPENLPPTPVPTPFTKWDVWMELFFGK